ncbi:hypothetical protein KSS87_021598 [Heliosperma pusillum]|nr:hypothetical protein KSS87_021598 [Heliosperma pusillum]
MDTGDLLNIQPTELKFQFELRKQSCCSMHLTNKTEKHVAFKVKTTNPKKYCVRPNTGVVVPGGTCDVTVDVGMIPEFSDVLNALDIGNVTMQAQKESPPDMQCKDKFLVQSATAPDGISAKDITPEMFNKEEGRIVEEFKLKVIYIPANPPSPVPEESEEGSPPRENGSEPTSLASAVRKSFEDSRDKSSESSSFNALFYDPLPSNSNLPATMVVTVVVGVLLSRTPSVVDARPSPSISPSGVGDGDQNDGSGCLGGHVETRTEQKTFRWHVDVFRDTDWSSGHLDGISLGLILVCYELSFKQASAVLLPHDEL